MKLNPDCVRTLLLSIEDETTYYNSWDYKSNNPPSSLNRYSPEEIAYHARQCALSNLIEELHVYGNCEHIQIKDLTPQGHEFLANIREHSVWSKTKSIASIVGSKSLSTLVQISTAVITELVKHHLGLT